MIRLTVLFCLGCRLASYASAVPNVTHHTAEHLTTIGRFQSDGRAPPRRAQHRAQQLPVGGQPHFRVCGRAAVRTTSSASTSPPRAPRHPLPSTGVRVAPAAQPAAGGTRASGGTQPPLLRHHCPRTRRRVRKGRQARAGAEGRPRAWGAWGTVGRGKTGAGPGLRPLGRSARRSGYLAGVRHLLPGRRGPHPETPGTRRKAQRRRAAAPAQQPAEGHCRRHLAD